MRHSACLEGCLRLLCELLPCVQTDAAMAIVFLDRVSTAADYLSDLFLLQTILPKVIHLLFSESVVVPVRACTALFAILQSLFFVPVEYRRLAVEFIYPALLDISRSEVSSALLIALAELIFDIQNTLQLHAIVTAFSFNEEKETVVQGIERDGEIFSGFTSEIIAALLERRDADLTTAVLIQLHRLALSVGTLTTTSIVKLYISPIVFAQVSREFLKSFQLQLCYKER